MLRRIARQPSSSSSHHAKTFKTPTTSSTVANSPFSPSFRPPCICDDDPEWISCFLEDNDDFTGVPSRREAQSALSALQRVMETASFSRLVGDKCGTSTETGESGRAVSPSRSSFMHRTMSSVSDSDWSEPSFQLLNPRALLDSRGTGTVYDAFHLLQTEPSIQRMVISLSSDPAVWNAVLNNAEVQELRQFIPPDDSNSITGLESDSEGSDAATSILKWIFNSTKSKALEIIEMINNLVNDLFQPIKGDRASTTSNACFEEKLRYSLMLTVMVLLVIAVDRAKRVQS